MIDPAPVLAASAALFLLGPLLAHALGGRLARRIEPGPRGARALMPLPPAASPEGEERGAGARRFLREVARAERAVLRRVEAGEGALEAAALAPALAESALTVETALERLASRLPHRLRIRRDGARIYDFRPDDAARLRAEGARSLALSSALTATAVLANIGAAAPLLISLGIAGAAISEVGALEDEDSLAFVALGATAAMALAVGLAVVAGFLLEAILAPRGGGPAVGRVEGLGAAGAAPAQIAADETPKRSRKAKGEAARERPSGAAGAPEARPKKEAAREGGGGGGSAANRGGGKSGGSWDFGKLLEGLGNDPKGCLVLLALLLFAAAVLASLAGVAAWAAGVYRAVARRRRAAEGPVPSPADWTRAPEEPDDLATVIPTNDIAIATTAALAEVSRDPRPRDGRLRERVLARAAARGGRIAPLEVVLDEGLDPDDALALASRLSAEAGGAGRIEFTAARDPDFAAPGAPGASAPPPEVERGEMLDPGRLQRITPAGGPLPSNLVGLAGGHLRAAARLAGGTALPAGIAAILLLAGMDPGAEPATDLGPGDRLTALEAAVLLAIAVMNLGTVVLAGTARHAARAAARAGILRDARRASILEAWRASVAGEAALDAGALATRLHAAACTAWPDAPREPFLAEAAAALLDLGLEPEGGAAAVHAGGATRFPLPPLRARLEALAALRARGADGGAAGAGAAGGAGAIGAVVGTAGGTGDGGAGTAPAPPTPETGGASTEVVFDSADHRPLAAT